MAIALCSWRGYQSNRPTHVAHFAVWVASAGLTGLVPLALGEAGRRAAALQGSGIGVGPQNFSRIFDALFST
jgi:hypothetical protein